MGVGALQGGFSLSWKRHERCTLRTAQRKLDGMG
jgi:hypothetical protein